MQIFILLMLIAVGAEAHFWRLFNHHPWFHGWEHKESPVNNNYQDKFSRYPQQNYQEVNFNIDQSANGAKWICKNPQTGATLIMPSKTMNQMMRPYDFSSSPFVEQKTNLNQENIKTKPNNVKNFDQDLIDVRLA